MKVMNRWMVVTCRIICNSKTMSNTKGSITECIHVIERSKAIKNYDLALYWLENNQTVNSGFHCWGI